MSSSASSSSASSTNITTLALQSPVQLEASAKPTLATAWYSDSANLKHIEAVANGPNSVLAPLAKKELEKAVALKADHKKKEAQLKDILKCSYALEKVRRIMEESVKKHGEWDEDLKVQANKYSPLLIDYEAYQKAEKKRKADGANSPPAKPAKKTKTDSTISPAKMMPKPQEAAAPKPIEMPEGLKTPPTSPTDADKMEMAESYMASAGGANCATLEGELRSAVVERRKRINGDGSKEDGEEDDANADAPAE